MASVYLATNKTNGKKYVGVTTQAVERRRWQHNYDAHQKDRILNIPFYTAIRKYGIDAFEFTILQTSDDYSYLCNIVEPMYISMLGTQDRSKGYNYTRGGEGHTGPSKRKGIPISRAQAERQRQLMLGRKQSPETIAKRVEKTRGMKRTDVTKDRMASEWQITFPSGEVRTVRNLAAFCREHSLTLPCMIQTANGTRKRHKGFTCIRVADGPQSRRKTSS